MAHPIQTVTDLHTATFEGNSCIPGTLYGTAVPVKILTHDDGGDPRSVTVTIGKHMFSVDALEYLMKLVDQHKKVIEGSKN